MNSITYIASDYPIPEIQNPHERSLSINEALEMGLEVPEYLLKNGIDRNWKNAIHWVDRSIHFDLDNGTIDDGDFEDDYAIIPIYPGRRDIHSAMKCQSRVEYIWSITRAKKILELISDLLVKPMKLNSGTSIWRTMKGLRSFTTTLSSVNLPRRI